jgi:glycosyltransferase involved in cell wall biosynthesis
MEFLAFIYVKIKQRKIKVERCIFNKPGKKNILLYHINGLSFGGTEKNLQMIAKYLNKEKYNVFFMHATNTEKDRSSYLNNNLVEIIKFNHDVVEKQWPYFINEMNPKINTIINKKNIDLIITATPGQSIYPIISITDIPIILINIFGSFSVQKNIKKHICISQEVKELAIRVVDEKLTEVEYIPSEKPIIDYERAKKIRMDFGIKDNDLVFGRIGRDSDSIFDPIGLNAFEITQKSYPNIHYIIMSPAPAAKKIVNERKMPNVHWIPPSYNEEDVWAFHQAIDVLAHFRMDGESFGLNIAESMLVGNPILTHRSHIWNAHTKYLEDSFSRVANKDDYLQYSKNMIEFIELHKKNQLEEMGQKAKEKAEKLFLIENSIYRYEKIIDEAL